jgi:hypothetical protein
MHLFKVLRAVTMKMWCRVVWYKFPGNVFVWRMMSSGMWRCVDIVLTDILENVSPPSSGYNKSTSDEPAWEGGCRSTWCRIPDDGILQSPPWKPVFRVKEVNQASSKEQAILAPSYMLIAGLIYSSALKMEVVHSSETSVNFHHTTYHHLPEENTLLLFAPCLAVCKRRT